MICEGSRSEKLQIYPGEADQIRFDQIDFSAVLKNGECAHRSGIDFANLSDIVGSKSMGRSRNQQINDRKVTDQFDRYRFFVTIG